MIQLNQLFGFPEVFRSGFKRRRKIINRRLPFQL
jgi:hypothetical protein